MFYTNIICSLIGVPVHEHVLEAQYGRNPGLTDYRLKGNRFTQPLFHACTDCDTMILSFIYGLLTGRAFPGRYCRCAVT